MQVQLRAARARTHPPILDQAIEHVLAHFPPVDSVSPRRPLALARLAVAHARLAGAKEVTANHVDLAAATIGLRVDATGAGDRRPDLPQPEPPSATPDSNHPHALGSAPEATPPSMDQSIRQPSDDDVPVVLPEDASKLPPTELPALPDPYPEDVVPEQRNLGSLQMPLGRHRAAGPAGPVIGNERAETLHDLDIVGTIFEAAKYQPIRRRNRPDAGSGLLLSARDLRRYRRMPKPDQVLALVLDHTCLTNCDWEEALLPHLRWAYRERASVCLVQVGAAGASEPLRAERIVVHNVLAPRLGAALATGPGRATPLAHGLDLMLRTLQAAMRHGRGAVQQGRLVVLSDGRGNVPLEASRSGTVTGPVGREGIEDALQVARATRTFRNVNAYLLNPQPRVHPDLPLALADALGAEAYPVPPLRAEGADHHDGYG